MGRFLLLDIGAGTMDVLYHDTGTGVQYKAVVRSPVLTVAEKAQRLSGDLLVLGSEMGGGPVSRVLVEKAREAKVILSASAASTLHHSMEKVRSLGITVVDDTVVEALLEEGRYPSLLLGDLEHDRLESLISTGFGVPFSFDVVGICAQDHGVPPEGVSHLDYRHQLFKAVLDRNPFPHALLYRADEVPVSLNRLRSIALSAKRLPADRVYVMDSGMAAILGASLDYHAVSREKVMVMDLATSHTVGASLEHGELAGFFEYHTRDITLRKLEALLVDLAEGRLRHEKVLEEGGHGAYLRKAIGFNQGEMIILTGPKRHLMASSSLSVIPGAPMGDNMMTGTAGVLEAIRRREGLRDLPYW